MNRCALIATLMLACPALAAAPDISKVNGSISVTAGRSFSNVSTVNGAIRIDDKAMIAHARTVNGSIALGAQTSARSLRTVNGSVSIGAGGRVAGAVTSVNGSITLERSADISGRLVNVNGRIRLDAAHVGGGIETVSGNIEIGADSRVEGGIWVKDAYTRGWFWNWFSSHCCKPSLVVIGPNAIVQGTLKFEHEVKLYVSTRARIGPIEGAQVIAFSGERPHA